MGKKKVLRKGKKDKKRGMFVRKYDFRNRFLPSAFMLRPSMFPCLSKHLTHKGFHHALI